MKADHDRIKRLLKTTQGQISNQIQAAAAMLQRANREVLHAHMRGCVIEAIQSGDPQETEKKIEELCAVFDRSQRSE